MDDLPQETRGEGGQVAKKQQATYSYRKGFGVRGLEAETAARELNRIRVERGGKLEPSAVVDEARPEDAPLHPAFEWDDDAAAESYRKLQARNLIRSIQVVRAKGQEREPVYFHVSVKASEGRHRFYQTSEGLRENEDQYASAVTELKNKVEQSAQALAVLRRVMEGAGSPDAHKLALLAALSESLATARNISDRLQ